MGRASGSNLNLKLLKLIKLVSPTSTHLAFLKMSKISSVTTQSHVIWKLCLASLTNRNLLTPICSGVAILNINLIYLHFWSRALAATDPGIQTFNKIYVRLLTMVARDPTFRTRTPSMKIPTQCTQITIASLINSQAYALNRIPLKRTMGRPNRPVSHLLLQIMDLKSQLSKLSRARVRCLFGHKI